jgi:TPR repeat protein
MTIAACGGGPGSASPSSDCPHGVIRNQTEADVAVDWANRWCGDDADMPMKGMVCTSFGDLAETGRCGYPKDLANARQFYQRACTRQYAPACKALSRLGVSSP